MRFGSAKSVRGRVGRLLATTVVVTATPVAAAYVASLAGVGDWPPRPSGPLGFACGVGVGAIVLFEMLLAPRKWLRGRRLGATRVWMKAHVWLGLVALPLVLVHAGFGFGGPLPATTLVLFLLVFASGVWGLALQQWLPQKFLTDMPGEVIAAQIPVLAEAAAGEAARVVAARPGPPRREVAGFLDRDLLPYLTRGRGSRSALAGRAEADRRFRELAAVSTPEAAIAWARLRELVDLRAQWDALAVYHFWLHNWLLVHLPLSVGMTALMLVHAVRALKYW